MVWLFAANIAVPTSNNMNARYMGFTVAYAEFDTMFANDTKNRDRRYGGYRPVACDEGF